MEWDTLFIPLKPSPVVGSVPMAWKEVLLTNLGIF